MRQPADRWAIKEDATSNGWTASIPHPAVLSYWKTLVAIQADPVFSSATGIQEELALAYAVREPVDLTRPFIYFLLLFPSTIPSAGH
jgi:hypothetical protein